MQTPNIASFESALLSTLFLRFAFEPDLAALHMHVLDPGLSHRLIVRYSKMLCPGLFLLP